MATSSLVNPREPALDVQYPDYGVLGRLRAGVGERVVHGIAGGGEGGGLGIGAVGLEIFFAAAGEGCGCGGLEGEGGEEAEVLRFVCEVWERRMLRCWEGR